MEAAVILKLIWFLTSRRYLYIFPLSNPPHCRFEMVMKHTLTPLNVPLSKELDSEVAGATGADRSGICLELL